jgi:hypothetical protein
MYFLDLQAQSLYLRIKNKKMPRKDLFHFAVREALEKEDWVITDDPLNLSIGEVDLLADLGAEKVIAAEKIDEKIAVEIKNFVGQSLVSEFHKALGQYENYRLSLKLTNSDRVVYLAVSKDAWEDFFQRPFIQAVIVAQNLKILVFEPTTHTIIQWIK